MVLDPPTLRYSTPAQRFSNFGIRDLTGQGNLGETV
jgi:hypothetical protein